MMGGILSSDLVNLVGFENLQGFLVNVNRLTKSKNEPPPVHSKREYGIMPNERVN
mgnify:CR=1 FL=1